MIPNEVLKRVEIRGIKCMRMQPDPNAPVFTLGFQDSYLIVGVGEDSFEGVLDRAKTPPPAWLTEAVDEVKVPRPGTFAYVNLQALIKMAGAMGGPEVQRALEVLGLTSMTRGVSMSGLDDSGFVSRTRIFTSAPDQGLAALLNGKPLQAQDLAGIPGDASFALALRLDAAQVLDGALDMLGEFEPRGAEEIRQGIAGTEQQLGIQLKRDLLQALGDVWTLHSAPSSGGLLAGWTLAVNVRDKERLEATHKKLLQIAQAILAQNPQCAADQDVHVQRNHGLHVSRARWCVPSDPVLVHHRYAPGCHIAPPGAEVIPQPGPGSRVTCRPTCGGSAVVCRSWALCAIVSGCAQPVHDVLSVHSNECTGCCRAAGE